MKVSEQKFSFIVHCKVKITQGEYLESLKCNLTWMKFIKLKSYILKVQATNKLISKQKIW